MKKKTTLLALVAILALPLTLVSCDSSAKEAAMDPETQAERAALFTEVKAEHADKDRKQLIDALCEAAWDTHQNAKAIEKAGEATEEAAAAVSEATEPEESILQNVASSLGF